MKYGIELNTERIDLMNTPLKLYVGLITEVINAKSNEIERQIILTRDIAEIEVYDSLYDAQAAEKTLISFNDNFKYTIIELEVETPETDQD